MDLISMNTKKSIATLVTELQDENEKLQFLNKLFNSACRHEFGYDVKEIHHIIEKVAIYERKMTEKPQSQTVFPHI